MAARTRRRLLMGAILALVGLPAFLVLALRFVNPPLTPLMVIRKVEGEEARHRWVALAQLPRHIGDAVIAAEDNRFCLHFGFDLEAIRDALRELDRGEGLRGASTISQQTAKNLFLWQGRSWLRKAIEAYFTVFLEALWDKRRILEVYLNIAEWGPGIFGIGEAAQVHFGKPARALSAREAALLAAILPSPRDWSPADAYARERADTILTRIRQLGPLLDCVRSKGSGQGG